MESVEQKVEALIQVWERGRIFFAQDFTELGSQENVRKTLVSLTNKCVIFRLARGIYYWPKYSSDNGSKMIIPSDDTIAYAIADRDKIRIIPYGDKAAYKLGLSSLLVSNSTYMTDGAPRIINVSNRHKIYFVHSSEMKIFSYTNTTMQEICSAMRVLGQARIGESERRIIQKALVKVSEIDFKENIQLPPAWVSDILIDIRYGLPI